MNLSLADLGSIATMVGVGLTDLASIATAVGVFLTVRQLGLTRKQAVTNFEDEFGREYRKLAAELPIKALDVTSLFRAG